MRPKQIKRVITLDSRRISEAVVVIAAYIKQSTPRRGWGNTRHKRCAIKAAICPREVNTRTHTYSLHRREIRKKMHAHDAGCVIADQQPVVAGADGISIGESSITS
jgi:hypothetical protein